jgi:hypothetical protein
MDIKQFNRNVRTIATSGKKLDELVHTTAVAGLVLIQADGNATRMDQLLQALPKGYRRQGFVLWVQAFSPIRWNGDGKVGVMKATAKTFTPFDVEGANAVPFWDFTQENKPGTLSLDAIMAILKRESDKLAKADENGDILDDEGKVRFHVEGNVTELRSRVEAARAAMAMPVQAPVVAAA